jgi:hypothetical protein
MIANAGKIFYSSAANQYNRVLLKVMTFTGDICRYFDAVRQADTRYFPERGIRLLWSCCVHSRADTPFLRISTERRRLALPFNFFPARSN